MANCTPSSIGLMKLTGRQWKMKQAKSEVTISLLGTYTPETFFTSWHAKSMLPCELIRSDQAHSGAAQTLASQTGLWESEHAGWWWFLRWSQLWVVHYPFWSTTSWSFHALYFSCCLMFFWFLRRIFWRLSIAYKCISIIFGGCCSSSTSGLGSPFQAQKRPFQATSSATETVNKKTK